VSNSEPRQPQSREGTKTISEYVDYLDSIFQSWKSKQDILGDMQIIQNLGASLRSTKGEQFLREVVEALSVRSPESAQALGSTWKVEWKDKSPSAVDAGAAKFKVGDRVHCAVSIDPGYGQIVKANYENGSWRYWIQREDKPSSWAPVKTAEHWLSNA